MISVRKQEFIEMFLLGFVYLVIGITGSMIRSNISNYIAIVLATMYSFYTKSKRKLIKEEDDDDSLQNKNIAGHITFLFILVVLTLFVSIMIIYSIIFGKGFDMTFTIDLNFLCIILGILKIVYYLAFMYSDRTE